MPIYRIGDLWQNKGYVDIPPEFRQIIWNAFSLPVSQPDEPEPDVEAVYREKMSKWNASPRSQIHEDCIRDLSVLRPHAAWQLMTISNVSFESNDGNRPSIDGCASVWRWQYYDFAFTIFWALSYHLTQVELEHLYFCWDELHRVAREAFPNAVTGTPEWRALHLALYERVMGLSFDAHRQVDCYVKNILHRPGLQEAALKKRKSLFDGYIEFFKIQIELELLK